MERYASLAVAAIVAGIMVRFLALGLYTVSGDACWHYSVAQYIGEQRHIPFDEKLGRYEPFWSPPLFHVISGFLYSLLGESGMKLLPVLSGSLFLIVAYLLLQKYLSKKALFAAMLFLSFIPIFIDYSVLGYVESTLMLMCTLSLYFALRERMLLAGIFAGLSMLTKYNGAFIVPVILFIVFMRYRGNEFIKKSAIVILSAGLVDVIWMLRNWILLGNPVWPFLNFIFGGMDSNSYSNLNVLNLIDPITYLAALLGFFGVPNGDYHALFFFSNPLILPLFVTFMIVSLMFCTPLVFGFKRSFMHKISYVLMGIFGLLFLLYVVNVGPLVTRMLLPMAVGLAFIYGVGFERMCKKWKKMETGIVALSIMACLGFALVTVVKFKISSESWEFYEDDFSWVKKNTAANAIFLANGQCIQYHIGRSALPREYIASESYEYAWFNDKFRLDPVSILTKEDVAYLQSKGFKEVYSNKITGTKIYKKR